MLLMIVGDAGIVTIIATLTLSFVGDIPRDETLLRLTVLLGGLLAVGVAVTRVG